MWDNRAAEARYAAYCDWWRTRRDTPAEIMPVLKNGAFDLIRLDKAGMQALGGGNELSARQAVQREGRLAVGGYDEDRAIYSGPVFASSPGAEPRTLHLGLDIFAMAGTPVYAPLPGHVHSFQDNANPKDYGPTIILAHAVSDTLTFYTLYGHLSRESLVGLAVGQPVTKGQSLATLGGGAVNGDWPPHLHFQIILDMMGKAGDFPGVFKKSERDIWKRICPDPAQFLEL